MITPQYLWTYLHSVTYVEYISPSVMVPEHRLETLLDQALMLQRIQCLYHNSDDHITLYSDHNCDR